MGAFYGLSQYFSNGIINKAIELRYSEPNILILTGDEFSLRNKYPDVWRCLISCEHQRDRRHPMEYGRDLVSSWVFEDCIIGSLRDAGLDVRHNGADKERQVLPHNNVTTDSDAVLIVNGICIPMEIMCDYTRYWTSSGSIDLRDNKYHRLKNSKSLFLGFSTVDNTVVILDFSKDLEYRYIEYHTAYGGKPVYSVKIPEDSIHPFEIDDMIGLIKSIIN